mgnify:CR=1 FL=1
MELKFYDIIKEPIITEKSMQLKEQYNKYTFKVAPNANKIEIKNAVEALFNVKVWMKLLVKKNTPCYGNKNRNQNLTE